MNDMSSALRKIVECSDIPREYLSATARQQLASEQTSAQDTHAANICFTCWWETLALHHGSYKCGMPQGFGLPFGLHLLKEPL